MVKYYSIAEYAEMTGLKECTVRKMVEDKSPEVEAVKTGNKTYIKVIENNVTDELINKVSDLEKVIKRFCVHFGISVEDIDAM